MFKLSLTSIILFLSMIIQIAKCQYYDDYYKSNNDNDYYVTESSITPEDSQEILKDILNGKAPVTVQNKSFIFKETDYNPSLRPNIMIDGKSNGSLEIIAMLSLKQIVSLDEKNQILTTSFYLMLKWIDQRLMWDPMQYNNITSIIVPANKFWLPELAIMNSALSSNFITYPSNQNIIVYYDGESYLTLSLPSQTTRCKLNVYKYPFDEQKCNIVIGSWTNTKREINFGKVNSSKKTILKNYINNSIWTLISIDESFIVDTSRFELFNFYRDNETRGGLKAEDMVITLRIKREPLYIMINGIFPCFILNCVILCAFWIPYAQQINLCKLKYALELNLNKFFTF